jgi:hypothetical protein
LFALLNLQCCVTSSRGDRVHGFGHLHGAPCSDRTGLPAVLSDHMHVNTCQAYVVWHNGVSRVPPPTPYCSRHAFCRNTEGNRLQCHTLGFLPRPALDGPLQQPTSRLCGARFWTDICTLEDANEFHAFAPLGRSPGV